MGFSPFAEATKYAKKYTETKKAPAKAAPVAKPKSAKASPKMTADLKKINSNSQTLAPTVNRLVQNIPTPTRQYTASELETPQMKKYTQMLQMKNKLTDSFLTSQAGGQEWRDKNFEERVATQGMDVTMAEVGQRKDAFRKETMLNAAKQPMNLIRQANERDKWIMGNWTQDDKQLLYEQTGKLADTVKHMPMAEIRRLAPDFIKKKEIEYKKTQETSRFLGAVAKQLDQDLVKIYGHDKISQMEATAAFSPDRMVTSALEAASLDVIEFDMLNQMGRDVYYKNGKMFYKGFEIDDEYITAAGQDADKTAKIVSSILGTLPTYAVGGAAIKAGIAGAQKLAKGQNLVKTAKFFGQIDKLAKTQSVWKSALAEATVFNVMEEGAEALIRKGTGQQYSFNNFLNGLMWGATLGGSVNIGMKGAQKGLNIAGDFVEMKQLQSQMQKAEQIFAKTGSFDAIKALPLGKGTFGGAFTETRFAYLKGLQNPDVRPGIEQAAPLPQSKPVEMTPLHEEAKKYASAEEFIGKQKKLYRGTTDATRDERTAEGVISTSENPDIAKIFSGKNGRVEEFVLAPDARIIALEDITKELRKTKDGSEISPKDWIDYAKKQGYDAIDMKSLKLSIQSRHDPSLKGFEDEIKILNFDILRDKSQLSKIWNEANAKTPDAGVTLKTDKMAYLRGSKKGEARVEAAREQADAEPVEVRRLKKRGEEMINEYIETSLKPTMKRGVEQGSVSRDAEGNVTKREGRVSGNDKWYSDFFKKEKRAPNRADLKEIAIDHLTNGHLDYSYDMPKDEEFVKILSDIQDQKLKTKQETFENDGIPVVKGVSKIGRTIAKDATKARLLNTFEDTAEYDKIKLTEQNEMAHNLVHGDIDLALEIVMGKKEVPSNMRSVALITALEDYGTRMGDGKILHALANSKLVSETSIFAQEMRLMAERAPESPTAAMQRIRQEREKVAIRREAKEVGRYFKNSMKELDRDLKKMEVAGNKKLADAIKAEQKELRAEIKKVSKVKTGDQMKAIVVTQIKKEIKKAAPKVKDWNSFIDSLTC